MLRVETLSIHIGRSYGTYQMHKTSAIGTTDMDAMEFIPLKIGESDMMEWGLNRYRLETGLIKIPFTGLGRNYTHLNKLKAPKRIVQGLLIKRRVTPIVIAFKL